MYRPLVLVVLLLTLLVAGSGTSVLPSPALPHAASFPASGPRLPPPLSSANRPSSPAPSTALSPASGCPLASARPLAKELLGTPAATTGGFAGDSAHSVDGQAVPNTGFEFNLTAYKMPFQVSNVNDTFLLSEEEEIGDTALLMGFISVGQFDQELLPFWAELNNRTDQFTTCGFTLTPTPVGTVVQFQALHVWENDWEVLFRGSPITCTCSPSSGNISLSYDQANWTGSIAVVTLGNWTGSTPWAPAYANLSAAMEVQTSSGWHLCHPVASEWNGTAGGPYWGEAGPLQLPYLAPGELQIGTGVAPVKNGTLLWSSSAPTALLVNVTATPANLSGDAPTRVTVHESAKDGVPIADLSVLLAYSGGGSFAPALPWTTNAQGVATGNFTTPIVSSLLVGTLTAQVSSPLYAGTGNTTVTVAPTTLVVLVTLSRTSVGVGKMVNVTTRALLGGSPLHGPPVDLDLTATVGGGAFSPLGPWVTDAQGYSNGTYLAPPTAGAVTLTFTVSVTGYSGSGSATLNVTGGSGTSGNSALLDYEYAGAAVVALIVVVLLAITLGRKKPSPAPEEEEEVEGSKKPSAASPTEKKVPAPKADSERPSCSACGADVSQAVGRFCPECGAPIKLGEKAAPAPLDFSA